MLNELNRYENEYFRLNKLQEERIRNYSGSHEDVARLREELNGYKVKMEETAASLQKVIQWRCIRQRGTKQHQKETRHQRRHSESDVGG